MKSPRGENIAKAQIHAAWFCGFEILNGTLNQENTAFLPQNVSPIIG